MDQQREYEHRQGGADFHDALRGQATYAVHDSTSQLRDRRNSPASPWSPTAATRRRHDVADPTAVSWDVNAFDGIEQALAFIVFGTALVTTVSTMVISMVARRFGRRRTPVRRSPLNVEAETSSRSAREPSATPRTSTPSHSVSSSSTGSMTAVIAEGRRGAFRSTATVGSYGVFSSEMTSGSQLPGVA
jgi:hypothetical protein